MSTQKKICLVLPSHWSAAFGGAEYQAKVIIDQLAGNKKCRIYYLTERFDPAFRNDHYTLTNICASKRLNRYGTFINAAHLYRALRCISPDFIYQRVGCALTGVCAFYARRNKCRMVWHIAHDNDVRPLPRINRLRYANATIEKKLLEYGVRNAECIVAQTIQQGIELERYYGRRPCRVVKNLHPPPREKIHKDKEINVIWVSNFKRWKQPEIFIDLAEAISRQGIAANFLMVGSLETANAEWKAEILDQIDATPNLSYLGPRSIDEVNRLIAGSHLFVNTSKYEGFPNTFIQAWMRRVPVISLNVDPDNILKEQAIGIHCGSYTKLLENTIELIQNKELCAEMGKQAGRYAMEAHSVANAQKIFDLFDS